MTFSPITAVIDGPTDTRAAVVFPPCCTDAALLPPCQGLQPQSDRMKSLTTLSLAAQDAQRAYDATRSHRALVRLCDAKTALLAAEVAHGV